LQDAAIAVPSAATVSPAFVLLFAMTADAAARRSTPPAGLQPMSETASQSYRSRMEPLERRLLGNTYGKASRLQRTAVGRFSLEGLAGDLTHADVHLVVHKCGAALWEVSLFGARQQVDVAKWSALLDFESRDSLARIVWERLAASRPSDALAPEMYVPLAILQFPDGALAPLVERYARDLVNLLHRETSGRFKDGFVAAELAADFCRDEHGLWLMARNGAVDVIAHAKEADEPQLPIDVLPFLLTLQVLCLDRAVLRSFLNRFERRTYGTVDDLIRLRAEMFDNLEEYYGTLAKTHGYTADSIARGEALFGIDDLFEAVVDRMEALTFEITTRNQRSVNRLGLWLTTSFGAIQTGSVAASVAVWYYTNNVPAVLGWTVGVTFLTALVISSLLRWRL